MLYAEVVPSVGGETEFADMQAAFDALDDKTKAKIENLSSYHSNQYSMAKRTGVFVSTSPMRPEAAALRPLVRTDPETGRKGLFAPIHSFGIPGMSREDSRELIEDLIGFACQAPRTYKHAWKVGDLVIWDQRSSFHRARPYPADEARYMRGTR